MDQVTVPPELGLSRNVEEKRFKQHFTVDLPEAGAFEKKDSFVSDCIKQAYLITSSVFENVVICIFHLKSEFIFYF